MLRRDGTHDRTVYRSTLTSAGGVRARILTYGGIVPALEVPDRQGRVRNVVLGSHELGSYLGKRPYVGALIGRCANRLAHGRSTLDGTTCQVPTNDGPHALHGGTRGFDERLWAPTEVRRGSSVGLELRCTSRDGEMGFPVS